MYSSFILKFCREIYKFVNLYWMIYVDVCNCFLRPGTTIYWWACKWMCVIHVHVMAFYCHQIRRKPSYLDVKIRSRTENGTPSNISPPRAHSPANNKPYVNVVDDDRSSDQLSVYKWYVVLPLLCTEHVILCTYITLFWIDSYGTWNCCT